MSKNKIYKAAIYLRLSKEDGDREESYSISNQRDLALDFIKRNNDIRLVCEMADDGYTGSDFNRPNFQKMIEKVSKGEIDCVIVKDLSRFARDYVGSGYYLEKLFPSMGVRFISINDNIDYKVDDSSNTKLIMAIKNVMNDSYIRDISVKIRSQFEVKRKNGKYVGAFVVYGYRKSDEDKHALVVDREAAEIVKTIFNMRLQGMSANAISDKLNLLNVPSPAEYKKQTGSNFSANLQKKIEAKWSAKAVLRILTNEIYTGTLIQGKRTTANYKIKKVIEKDRSEWAIIPNNHEPVISAEQFETVQKLLKQDTRVNPGNKEPYLFSGFIECADCHSSLIRRKATYNNKTYSYYMCSTNKLGLGCSSHRVNENVLYESVLTAINTYCKNVTDLSEKLKNIPMDKIKEAKMRTIEASKQKNEAEIKDLQHTVDVVEQMCSSNMESADSCREICADIRVEIDKLKHELEKLSNEKADIEEEILSNTAWIKTFTKNGDIKTLTRVVLSRLIEKIYVYEDKRIVIRFNYQDKYNSLLLLDESLNTKEAV